MKRGGVQQHVAGVLVAAALVLAVTGATLASEVFVDVVINGTLLEGGALVYGDRTYVALEDVAAVLGGRFVYDLDIKTAFVLTGRYLSLMADELVALNPDLDAYSPIGRFVEHRGIPYGMEQPHLTVTFLPAGLVTAFARIFVDEGVTHAPWFDQSPGRFERFIAGDGYSQHLFVIDPSLVEAGGETRVAFNGRALNVGTDALYWLGDRLYVRLRDLAEASGGGVGWDVAARVATAKIVPGADLTWDTLVSFNVRTARYYDENPPFVPALGYRRTTGGEGLIVAVDGSQRLTAIGTLFREGVTPWFPWFDQVYGAAAEFPGFGRAYSQHIYLVDKEEIEF